MAIKKLYIGSQGPLLYNDEDPLPEDRSVANPRLQMALRAEDIYIGDPDDNDPGGGGTEMESVASHLGDNSIHTERSQILAINWFFS